MKFTRKLDGKHKHYKELFEQVKQPAKRLHFSNLITIYRNNIVMKRSVIREAIEKKSCWHIF